jgi:hypothetical protein
VKPIAEPEIGGNVLIVLIVHLLRIVGMLTVRDRKADRPGIAVRMARANPVKDVASSVFANRVASQWSTSANRLLILG